MSGREGRALDEVQFARDLGVVDGGGAAREQFFTRVRVTGNDAAELGCGIRIGLVKLGAEMFTRPLRPVFVV